MQTEADIGVSDLLSITFFVMFSFENSSLSPFGGVCLYVDIRQIKIRLFRLVEMEITLPIFF